MAEAEAFLNASRLPTPRHLKDEESIESLTHWWTVFRNYYRRDKYVGGFLVSTAKWDPSKDYYGFEDEATGLKRSKADCVMNSKSEYHAATCLGSASRWEILKCSRKFSREEKQRNKKMN